MKFLETRLKKIESKSKIKNFVVYFVEDGKIVGGKHSGKNIEEVDLTNARIIPLEWV